MSTLRELLDTYEPFNIPDERIIQEYFIQNGKEEYAIQVLSNLAFAKIAAQRAKLNYAEGMARFVPFDVLVKQYGRKNGQLLIDLSMFVLFHTVQCGGLDRTERLECDLPDEMVERLRQVVPTLEKPKYAFLQVALQALHDVGIYFKGEQE